MERIPSPNFGIPVRWLRLGDLQLHLFQVEEDRHTYQHFGFEVDDFEAAYLRLKELGIFDQSERFGSLCELPGGEVQMYFRDPADNFVEIDWPDVSSLDRSVFGDDLKLLADDFPRTRRTARALFLERGRVSVSRSSGSRTLDARVAPGRVHGRGTDRLRSRRRPRRLFFGDLLGRPGRGPAHRSDQRQQRGAPSRGISTAFATSVPDVPVVSCGNEEGLQQQLVEPSGRVDRLAHP